MVGFPNTPLFVAMKNGKSKLACVTPFVKKKTSNLNSKFSMYHNNLQHLFQIF